MKQKKQTINTDHYPKIWFTSDWHLGHNKEFLYGPRGASSRDSHVLLLIKAINKCAGPDDLIVHLGDMSLTATYEEFIGWLNDIKCKNIWSLIGNHDSNFSRYMERRNNAATFHNPPLRPDAEEALDDKDIRSLGQYKEITVMEPSEEVGKKARRYPVTLCHFPMLVWNNSQHGAYHLCGHSHGSCVQSGPFTEMGRRLDVGVEVVQNYDRGIKVMFEWEVIKRIMKTKQIEKLDHHNEETT